MFYFEDRRRQRQEESNKVLMQTLNAVKEPKDFEKTILTALF